NTTRLLVADVDNGRIDEVHRETRITRLGEGVDARGRLLPVPIARVRNALSDYRRTLEGLGAARTLAVATSAVRDAENGEAFLGDRVQLNARVAIGVAGTVTTLAALDLGLDQYDRDRVHGHRLTKAAARAQLARLAALPLDARRELKAMEPERAPVIVAGAVIL